MTLRQLLESVSFDNLVPIINQHVQYREYLCQYKQAYDILLHLPHTKGECKDVNVWLCQDDPYGDEYLDAWQIEQGSWDSYIDGNVILEKGITASPEEVVVRLLWHLTYYGFSPEEIIRTKEGFRNKD